MSRQPGFQGAIARAIIAYTEQPPASLAEALAQARVMLAGRELLTAAHIALGELKMLTVRAPQLGRDDPIALLERAIAAAEAQP